MEGEDLLMHYGVRVAPFRHEGTEQMYFLAYVSLPDGRILQSQCCENLSFIKQRKELLTSLTSTMAARLIEGLYKDMQDKISKIIFEEIQK